jgi:predicted RNA-binding protein associated with RNAse of E/G family
MTTPRPIEYGYLRPPDRLSVFHATLLHESEEYIVLTHTVHPSQPVIQLGKPALLDGSSITWFLFKDRSYDVGLFYLPDGTWSGYYIDLTEPVHWEGSNAGTLETVVDLFLDIWIAPSGEHELLDEDELVLAEAHGWVTAAQVAHAYRAREDVLAEMKAGTFPPASVLCWQHDRERG